jgi:hypothetical protein
MSHMHTAQTREQTYNILPRRVGKEGAGGYGMGVAPHPGYHQTPTVIGLPDPYVPPDVSHLAPSKLIAVRKKNGPEFNRLLEPSPWMSTRKCELQYFENALERKAANPHVQNMNKTITPSETSGFIGSQGSSGGAFAGYGKGNPAEWYTQEKLMKMKQTNPTEFWDLIRKADNPASIDTQTTSANFQMLGTHPNDPRYYWTSKTAVGLM